MSIIESEPSAETLDPLAVHGWSAVHRFTVAEYQRLGEAGILTEDDRVELLDGRIRIVDLPGRRVKSFATPAPPPATTQPTTAHGNSSD